MSKYKEILDEETLYPPDFIKTFGMSSPHWMTMTWREKENLLRHNMVCILLANMEMAKNMNPMDIADMTLKRHYSNLTGSSTDSTYRAKRLKRDSFNDISLDMTEIDNNNEDQPTTSSGARSISLDDESKVRDEEKTEMYRFKVIEGAPNAAHIQSHFADRWGIKNPKTKWDVIDTDEKKFVEIKVSVNFKRCEAEYGDKKLGVSDNCCLFYANPETLEMIWLDHAGYASGQSKVLTFLTKRLHKIRELGLLDSELHESVNLSSTVFTCDWFDGMVNTWVDSFWDLTKDKELGIKDEEYYKGKIPNPVSMKEILGLLDKLNEKERTATLTWRGKIIPDGWCRNIRTTLDKDSDIVNLFMKSIEKEEILDIEYVNYKENKRPDKDFLASFIEIWRNHSKDNTFMVIDPYRTLETGSVINKMLGIGAKNRLLNPGDTSTKQRTYKIEQPAKYHTWIDEVIRRLNAINDDKYRSMIHLKQIIPEGVNPINVLTKKMGEEMVECISQTNAARYCSRLTNFYSRMGGSYLVWMNNKKRTSHGYIAYFPILSTLRNNENLNDVVRDVSGIVFRGPHHAKSATDKINIVTIEVLPLASDTVTFCRHLRKAALYYTKSEIICIRQNAMMKDDPTFLTFTENALMMPFNMLGDMTISNEAISYMRGQEVEYCNGVLEESKQWIQERFTEGVIMAAIGDSNDEGYFAGLRKLFMVLYKLKDNQNCFCWDIKTFCHKVNLCLINNPISFHFHNTYLKCLRSNIASLESMSILNSN